MSRLAFILFSLGYIFSATLFPTTSYAQNPSDSKAAYFEKQFKAAKTLAADKDWLEAQKKARALIAATPSDKERIALFDFLRDVRFELLFVKKVTDTSEFYEVQSGDSLGKIAKKYKTTIDLIRHANHLKKKSIRPDMKLKVEKVPFQIEVSLKKNILWLKQDKHYVRKYIVSTGENGNTPLGDYKIANKVENPTWYFENEVIPPGDPKNGLGSRWLGFDLKGYGIHGTIEPDKIGKPVSLGCVRMHNKDVEEIFELIPIGTPVKITK